MDSDQLMQPLHDDFTKYLSNDELNSGSIDSLIQKHYKSAQSLNKITTQPNKKKNIALTGASAGASSFSANGTTTAVRKRFRPCNGCRKRRTKCSLIEGSKICQECAKRNLECKFDNEDSSSSKLSASSGSSALISCDNCTHRRTTCVVPPNSKICTECSLRDLQCKFTANDSLKNAKIRTVTPIIDYDNYNGPTIMRKTLSLQGPKSSKFIGPSSIIEKNLLSYHHDYVSPNSMINQEQYYFDESLKLRRINNDVLFKITNDNEESIKLSYSQVDEVEKIVYPHGLNLINLYFKYVHPLLPVIIKPVFLEKYSRTHREFDPLLLSLIYLHALNYWNFDPALDTLVKPSVDKLERFVLILYSESWINLPPRFSTCQGLLLLMNYNFKNIDSNKNLLKNSINNIDPWKLISQLVTISEELGLNNNSDEWESIPKWERKIRKIETWTVILFDKLYSLFEFRPSRINQDNWILNELELDDFKSNEEIFIEKINSTENFVINFGIHNDEGIIIGNLIFIQMVHLSYHVNDILNEIYNLKSLRFDDFNIVFLKSENLLNNLNKWFELLPQTLIEFNDNPLLNTVSSASLLLTFFTVKFLVYRRILNCFIESISFLENENFQSFKLMFKEIVKDFAKLNTILLEKLNPSHFNNFFWYSDSTKCFIIIGLVKALMIKISKDEFYIDNEYDTNYLIDDYSNYRNYLNLFGNDFLQAKLALSHLDTLVSSDGKMESFKYVI